MGGAQGRGIPVRPSMKCRRGQKFVFLANCQCPRINLCGERPDCWWALMAIIKRESQVSDEWWMLIGATAQIGGTQGNVFPLGSNPHNWPVLFDWAGACVFLADVPHYQNICKSLGNGFSGLCSSSLAYFDCFMRGGWDVYFRTQLMALFVRKLLSHFWR